MRLFSFLLIFTLLATCAYAQEQDRMSFGVLGGINFQNLNGKTYTGDKLENDMILGYHAGINIRIPVVPEFFFQPALLFSTKGGKSVNETNTTTYKLSYIEMPLNLVYKGLLGSGYVIVGFGPYIGYGLAGKVVTEGTLGTVDTDIEFQSSVDISDPATVSYFKAFDAGGNVFFGYEMAGGLFFQMNAQLGMIKIIPEDKRVIADTSVLKNTGFGFSIGYHF